MITLTGNYTPIPEGIHVFKITGVEYKEAFGKMEITMETATGRKHVERFTLTDGHGKVNEKAMNAFSYFAKAAMNNFDLTEIDEQELIGHYLLCEVEHDIQPHRDDPNKTVTFIRLKSKEPCDGFESEPKKEETAVEVGEDFDLDGFLED